MPHTSLSDHSGSLVERLSLPPVRTGPLEGTTFTVKDTIDIAGHKTSYGSPAWRDAHPAAKYNAFCVDQMLAAGAHCVGKVVADEFTYSLCGESQFFGTPRNAKAPGRIPGGSSSGSAASVANGLADFSIGSDSAGSIRVPASFCGLWGVRPSLHRISEAGVLPFMPSVSTVGILAACFDHLKAATRVALRCGSNREEPLQRILVLSDAMEVVDEAVQDQAYTALEHVSQRTGLSLEPVRFSQIVDDDLPLSACNINALRDQQTAEFQSTVGSWIEINKPELSHAFAMAYGNVQSFDRFAVLDSFARCERFFEKINAALPPGTVICFPTTPFIAPLKGSLTDIDAVLDFYERTMTITAFSGVGRLPEVSAPLLTVDGCPVGLSFAAMHYQDEFLLTAVQEMTA